jgi:hypothetical protein
MALYIIYAEHHKITEAIGKKGRYEYHLSHAEMHYLKIIHTVLYAAYLGGLGIEWRMM